MPKETRARSGSFKAQSHASPYTGIGSSRGSSSSQGPPDSSTSTKISKEWDEVRCPVCMEHPHNAVLLVCTSSDKGCHPFMCDTSHRHSNCLDQYMKSFSSSTPKDNGAVELNSNPFSKLLCPLCRGGVTGRIVVEAARRYMNSKVRSCSKESCVVTGSYGELRKHARIEHPLVRPSEADLGRQREWRRMEQQRDLGDLFSTMQSALGLEDGGGIRRIFDGEDEDISESTVYPISSVAVFFIFRIGSSSSISGTLRTSARSARSLSARATSARASSRASSVGASRRSRRGRSTILWGETYNEPEPADGNASHPINLADDDEDVDNDVDLGDGDVDGSGVDVGPRLRSRSHRRQLRMSRDESDSEDLS